MRRIDTIAVHCSATRPGQDWGVEEIRRLHVDEFGWSDIGYHYVIRRSGAVEAGRPEAQAGAHVKGFNAHSIGVCMVGGLDRSGWPAPEFTPAQFEALGELLAELMQRHHVQREAVRGHRDFPDVAKACPCFDVQHWLQTGEVAA